MAPPSGETKGCGRADCPCGEACGCGTGCNCATAEVKCTSKEQAAAQEEDDDDESEEGALDPHTPPKIETGDSIKVKQVLDDATVDAVIRVCGYSADFYLENLKLFLMLLSCIFAMVAQFYPMPFPDNRPLLGVCCASYGLLSAVLQFMLTFVDKDTILLTKSSAEYPVELRVRTNFPRFQDEFLLTVQRRAFTPPPGLKIPAQAPAPAAVKAGGKPSKKDAGSGAGAAGSEKQGDISTVRMYVGRYFTEQGEFDEERFHYDVRAHLQRLEKGQAPVEYALAFKDKSD